MAELNVLKAGYNGKLGATTGVLNYMGAIIKGCIWSKRPPSYFQRDSRIAFEALNRVSAVLAKKWAKWLDLDTRKMLPHNAVAKKFKAVVVTHDFTPANFGVYSTETDKITLDDIYYTPESSNLRFKATASIADWDKGIASWFIVVCDRDGNVMFSVEPSATQFTFDAAITPKNPSAIYVMAWAATTVRTKHKITAFASNDYWSNHTFFAYAISNTKSAAVHDHVWEYEADYVVFDDYMHELLIM